MIERLRGEGFEIFIGEDASKIPANTTRIIYSEAIITKPDLPVEEQIYSHSELKFAKENKIIHIPYPVALAEIFNAKKGIAVAGSHGKSTTSSILTITLKDNPGCSAIIGTQVPQLNFSNCHSEKSPYFVVEACEYKRAFLAYKPYISVITNIDLDHLDYYKDLEDYLSAFQTLVDQTSGFVVISADDANSLALEIPLAKKVIVGNGTICYWAKVENIETSEVSYQKKYLPLPDLSLKIPGSHILQDANLVYTVAKLLQVADEVSIPKIESYQGAWRRFEIIKETKNKNILMSDYGHHPTEIKFTLSALREKYPKKKLFVVFQPHQYSRTRELLDEFATAFSNADRVIIPNIYFSRDKQEDVDFMTVERFIDTVQPFQENIQNGNGLENTLSLIQEYDTFHPDSSVILLLGAGDVDTLRDKID